MRHDGAQMMLLAAVLLILGFVALAGIVSVAQRLGDETLQEQGSPLEREFQQVYAHLQAQLDALNDGMNTPTQVHDAMEPLAEQMARIETRRGLVMSPISNTLGFVVNDCGGAGWYVQFSLSDDLTRLQAQVAPTDPLCP